MDRPRLSHGSGPVCTSAARSISGVPVKLSTGRKLSSLRALGSRSSDTERARVCDGAGPGTLLGFLAMEPKASKTGGFTRSVGRISGAGRLARAIALGALVAAPALVLVAGCSDQEKPADSSPPPVATVLSPVPAPAGLAAELYLPSPAAAWKKARALIGGPMVFLPASFGGLVTSLL